MKKLVCQTFLGLALVLCGPFAVVAQVPRPTGNYNYIIGSPDCTPLTGVTVTVNFSQSGVVSNGIGFGFQLSAWSLVPPSPPNQPPPPQPHIVWQQYMTGVASAVPGTPPYYINPTMQNFEASNGLGSSAGLLLVQDWGDSLMTLQGAQIPQNYQLAIQLLYDDANHPNNVTGATFTVLTPTFPEDPAPATYRVTKHWNLVPNFNKDNLAPIWGFQFNFNGGAGNIVALTSAPGYGTAGTITYTATSPMMVWASVPTVPQNCAAVSALGGNDVTAEVANGNYGAITPNPGPSTVFTQTFGVDSPVPSGISP